MSKLLLQYMHRLNMLGIKGVERGTRLQHAKWMCDHAEANIEEPAKANRWLGFIQAWLVAENIYSIDECVEHTRTYLNIEPVQPDSPNVVAPESESPEQTDGAPSPPRTTRPPSQVRSTLIPAPATTGDCATFDGDGGLGLRPAARFAELISASLREDGSISGAAEAHYRKWAHIPELKGLMDADLELKRGYLAHAREQSRVQFSAERADVSEINEAPALSADSDPEFSDRMVWIDLETTGIGDDDLILEIAVIVTDNALNELGHLSTLVRPCWHRPKTSSVSNYCDCPTKNLVPASEFLKNQNAEPDLKFPCWDQHFESGLVAELVLFEESLRLPGSISQKIIEFLSKYGIDPDADPDLRPPLCGSSVHFDRRFIRRDMPKLYDILHYRNVDVSGIRELARRFSPNLEIPKPESKHRAMDDLIDSLELLRFFRRSGFLGTRHG